MSRRPGDDRPPRAGARPVLCHRASGGGQGWRRQLAVPFPITRSLPLAPRSRQRTGHRPARRPPPGHHRNPPQDLPGYICPGRRTPRVPWPSMPRRKGHPARPPGDSVHRDRHVVHARRRLER